MKKRAESSYEFGPFVLNSVERLLWRDGKPVPLTQKAFETLLALVERHGHLVEKDELMKAVWADTFVEEANLAQNIFVLRKALGGKDGNNRYIETVPRRGYRFIASVKALPYERTSPLSPSNHEAEHRLNTQARSSEQAITSLAVLPFVNDSSDEKAEYLSHGIAESIIKLLSPLAQLRVMAHSASFRYKGREVDPQAAGRELGVQTVLTGRVLQLGKRLIIRAELVDVSAGWQLWGEQYDRHPSDILEVQEEIAREISDKLRLKLSSDERKHLARRYTDNTEAYHLYLKGRYLWNKFHVKYVMKGIEYFQQAIETDPSYALAYAGLADSYHRLSSLSLSPQEAMSKAKAAAVKAVECDDLLAEAHLSLGVVKLFYDYELDEAEREYKRAIELNPGASLAHLRYGAYLLYMERLDEAQAELEQALELDPLSLQVHVGLGSVHYMKGDYERAIKQNQKALELDQNYYPAHFCLGLVYIQQKKYAEAIVEFQNAYSSVKDFSMPLAFIGYAYAVSGQREAAKRTLAQLKRNAGRSYISTYGIAVLYTGLGENEQALEWLEKAYEEHSDWLVWLRAAPEFIPLRSEPGFLDLLRRIGFPAKY